MAEGDRGNKAMDVDTVRLLKTQDMQYLRTVRTRAAKEVKALEEQAILTRALSGGVDHDDNDGDDYGYDDDDGNDGDDDDVLGQLPRPRRPISTKPSRIVFMDVDDDRGQGQHKVPGSGKNEDAHMKGGGLHGSLGGGGLDGSEGSDGFDGFDDEQGGEEPAGAATGIMVDRQAEKAARLRRKLHNAKKRLKTFAEAEQALDLQRARMAKTPTVGGVTKRGKKVQVRERKR